MERKREKKRIGMWAENHVFWNFQERYKEKYGTCEVLEDGTNRYKDLDSGKTIAMRWNNDPENRPVDEKNNELWDSGQPFDIEIIKTVNDVAKKRMIEVKGTPQSYVHFFLGSSEWRCLLSSGSKEFQIWVITNTETEFPGCTKYKDFSNALIEFNYISKTEFTGSKVEVKEQGHTESQ